MHEYNTLEQDAMQSMPYDKWLGDVQEALNSINMSIDDWQNVWPFDFRKE